VEERTTIALEGKVRDRLRSVCMKGETYSAGVSRILNTLEEREGLQSKRQVLNEKYGIRP
jgi:hypothetical protein